MAACEGSLIHLESLEQSFGCFIVLQSTHKQNNRSDLAAVFPQRVKLLSTIGRATKPLRRVSHRALQNLQMLTFHSAMRSAQH